MDMVGLQTFLAVKNVLNFTVAARELGFAQSTVSAQIKQLEEELGYPLFERSGKRIFLSSGGVQFAPIASDTLYLYSKAKTLTSNAMEITGDLRMGILESLLSTFTETIVPQFRSRYKNVNLRIIVNNTAELTSLLNQGQIDIAYISSTSKANSALRCFYIRKEELVFIASPANPLSEANSVSIYDILRYPIITTEENGICYINLQEITADYGMTIPHLTQINNTNAICQVVQQSDSIAYLPAYSVKQRVEEGALRILHTNIPTQEYYIKVVSRKNKWIDPYTEDLIETIKRTF